MCSPASQTCRRTGLLNCCHGIGTIRTCRWSLELGVMLYAIRGPRRVLSELTKEGWVNAASGKPLAVRVTYWKPYVETLPKSKAREAENPASEDRHRARLSSREARRDD